MCFWLFGPWIDWWVLEASPVKTTSPYMLYTSFWSCRGPLGAQFTLDQHYFWHIRKALTEGFHNLQEIFGVWCILTILWHNQRFKKTCDFTLHFIFPTSGYTCSSQGKTHSWPGCRCNMRWRGQQGWRAGAVRTAEGTFSSQYGVLTNSWWWSCFHKGHMGGLSGYGGTSLVRQTLKTRNISYIPLHCSCNCPCNSWWITLY